MLYRKFFGGECVDTGDAASKQYKCEASSNTIKLFTMDKICGDTTATATASTTDITVSGTTCVEYDSYTDSAGTAQKTYIKFQTAASSC